MATVMDVRRRESSVMARRYGRAGTQTMGETPGSVVVWAPGGDRIERARQRGARVEPAEDVSQRAPVGFCDGKPARGGEPAGATRSTDDAGVATSTSALPPWQHRQPPRQ